MDHPLGTPAAPGAGAAPDARRCPWAGDGGAMRAYHDHEWGRPHRDETHLFEMLVLEGAQAGLSWRTVLERREGYRRAFAGFDPAVVAGWGEAETARLLADTGIVRNRAKVRSALANAGAFGALAAEHGSFSAWLWGQVDGVPIVNQPEQPEDVPVTSELGDRLSRDLRRRGFSFVGPTIVHSYLEAVGVIDDHLVGCPAKIRAR